MKSRQPNGRRRSGAAIVALALVCAGAAGAESSLIDRVGSVFDDVAWGFNLVGEKAQSLFGPGLGFGDEKTGGHAYAREFDQTYPVGPGATVSVSNEFGFGEVRVATWDNQLVQVYAEIAVRAESADLAQEIARSIEVRVDLAENLLDVRTILPDTRAETGQPTIQVNYALTIPKDANLVAKNDFGDTYVAGIGGRVAMDVRYGAIGIRDVAGPVSVRSRGEYALRAEGLRQGGTFELDGAPAEFANVAGPLKVTNFRGSVDLRNLGPEADVGVVSESGPIYYHVTEDAAPDLTATVLLGDIESDIPLSRASHGSVSVARTANIESQQRVSLRATFANILIQRDGVEPPVRTDTTSGTELFKEVVEHSERVADNIAVTVEAVTGNIRITGTDSRDVRIAATKFVRVQSQSNVRAALQALGFSVTHNGDEALAIRTLVADNMEALGCSSYRVDLAIECPRTAAVTVHAQDGHTSIRDTGGPVVVRQAAGAVTVQHVKAEVDLANEKGGIEVSRCAGPLKASVAHGALTLNEIYGAVTTDGLDGKTVIESPHAAVTARNTGGDVRIIAFEGIGGDYDVFVERGNISILLPPATDASLSVSAENGFVTTSSAIPLTGSIKKGRQEFIKTNTGPHRITLQTKNGDIIID